ncbi:hypothetical protein DKY63_17200 [Pseudomonas putida]|uniref:Uncharacterized protein n=1 Tax=Pseudomonas putida TaxID=303 RepID=A0A2Z4RKR6_PSEPU|nr:hypothetical protein DKY63_17200 [Pseudomonas putida]
MAGIGIRSGKLSATSRKNKRKRLLGHVANEQGDAPPVGAQLAGDGGFEGAIASKLCSYRGISGI